MDITFIVAVNNEKVYLSSFLASPAFKGNNRVQILPQRNYRTASQAYNAGIDSSENDLMVFAHQDIIFPESWIIDLITAIKHLAKNDPEWGVLGCFGSKKNRPGGVGQVYTNGRGIHGNNIMNPESVETLDEIVLVMRKTSKLRFDDQLPHFHMYGTDICMSARERGFASYAIPAFCIHNTTQLIDLPNEFFECYRYMKKKWRKYLPIYTSCITITCFDGDIYERRMNRLYRWLFRRPIEAHCRAENPETLLKDINRDQF